MKSKVCKKCGYCEECGRGGSYHYYPINYPQPYWQYPHIYPTQTHYWSTVPSSNTQTQQSWSLNDLTFG